MHHKEENVGFTNYNTSKQAKTDLIYLILLFIIFFFRFFVLFFHNLFSFI